MTFPILFGAILSLGMLMSGTFNAALADGEIAAADAIKKISSGAITVDVRTAEEFASGHLEGALHLPYDQIASRIAELESFRDKEVVLYCRSGRRSAIAQQELSKLGFKSAYNAGGLEDLQAAGAKVAR